MWLAANLSARVQAVAKKKMEGCVNFTTSIVILWPVTFGHYSLRPIKSTILDVFRQISGGMKIVSCPYFLSHVVCFGMQFISRHLIRQVIEIQSLKLHSLFVGYFSNTELHFPWDGESS